MADLIGFISLKNDALFVVRLEFEYLDRRGTWVHAGGTGDITLGKTKKASPGDYGVQDGSTVRLKAWVAGGSDKYSSEEFTYKTGIESTAYYTISGTTLINNLKFDRVEPIYVLPTDVRLNKTSLPLKVGSSETLIATVAPPNATNKSVTWTTSSVTVTRVEASGKVTALKEGTATITVTTVEGNNARCTVTVTTVDVMPSITEQPENQKSKHVEEVAY